MSLITREATLAQSSASHANSLHSTGPCSERGRAVSSQNARKPRPFPEVIARSMEALGENRTDFEQMHEALVEAMEPRDGWEAAWVQDIAILRWRLERLQRAEAAVLAVRKRKLAGERKRESMPASGLADLGQRAQIAVVGFTGLPESPWKFQQVIQFLHHLRDLLRGGVLEKDGVVYFDMLYGKNPGAQGAVLRGRYEALAKRYAQGEFKEGSDEHIALIESVNQEISNYEQKQALYAAEHAENDPVREDADLLLPRQELDDVVRFETHLEDQIERKLRQFYARRREPVLRRAETQPPAIDEIKVGELACQTASEGS